MMSQASEIDFDFGAFEEFAGYGPNHSPKKSEREKAYHSWLESFEAKDDKEYQRLSVAEALEFIHLLFSWPPLVEDARQVARNQDMVEQLEAEGVTVEDAMKAANEKYPMGPNSYHLSDFGRWFCFQRDIHLPPTHGMRSLTGTFWKMIADDASQDEATMVSYMRRNRAIEYLVPELGPKGADQ